jgi:hypothetical protein
MNATFFRYTGNPKKVLKQLSGGITVSGIQPFEDLSEQNPSLIVSYNPAIYDCNYVVIDGHYYFITDRFLQTGNRIEITCKKDVLTDLLTNGNNSVLNLPVIVERSSSDYNSYISDSMQSEQVNYTTYSIAFDTDFALNSSIIVCAIGGE